MLIIMINDIKTVDKSSKTSIAPLPLPIVVAISLYTLNKAVSGCFQDVDAYTWIITKLSPIQSILSV